MQPGTEHIKKNILVIEDDTHLREMLCYFISTIEGCSVTCYSNGKGASEKILNEVPELVILDIQLPYFSGIEILKEVRSAGFDNPIIVMTANDSEIAETNSLSLGANDYIPKPVRTSALKARIENLLQKSTIVEDHNIDSIFTLDTKRSILIFDNIEIPIVGSESEIIEILANENRPIPVHDLFERVHNFQYNPEDRSIYMRISSIRKKISSLLPDVSLIKNRRTKGFYLNYKVVIK